MYYNDYFKDKAKEETIESISAIILIVILSFLLFSFGSWIITLIALHFFNFIIPFKWSYALGAWLILSIIKIFIK